LGGGADFGAGFWELLALGARRRRHVALIERAMGPVWEANHVWLIFAGVLLFGGFPRAYADVITSVYVPLTLFLFGVVLRGAMFTFRHYDVAHRERRPWYGALFASSSLVSPFFLGVAAGVLMTPIESPKDSQAFTVFTCTAGLFVVALCALLSAVYLSWEARDEQLADDFRRRAMAALGALVILGAMALALSRRAAPHAFACATSRSPAVSCLVAACVSGGCLAATLWRRRYVAARRWVIAMAASIVVGFPLQRFPYVLEPRWSVDASAADPKTLHFLLVTSALGMVLLVPSLVLLFSVFKARAASNEAAGADVSDDD
jgi:cytochrome d ubiquinol oxidase subunit II